MKRLFIQGPSLGTRLLLFLLLSIVLMTVDHRYHHLESLRSALSVVVYPLRYVVNIPSEIGDWASQTFASRDTLQDDNRTLHTRNLLLKAQLQRMDALEAENTRLRELLRASKKVGERVLVAELLAVDTDPFTRLIVLNKGSTDQVYPGQPLVDAEGVMGQVVHVGPFTSTAMLITDPSHATPVLVNRNGLRAIAVGTGASGTLDLPHLPNNADIKPGDLLVTSGLGGVFPPGYPVGRVTKVEIDPSLPFANIEAEPAAHLERSREVLLVWTNHKRPPPQAAAPDGKVSK
ncbi:MAG: rod shape-determining protein MreC [Gammaproteobacteria bacterium]